MKLTTKVYSRFIVGMNLRKVKHKGIIYDFSLIPKPFQHKILRNSYELDEIEILKKVLNKISSKEISILEIGSSIGFVSLNVARIDKRVKIFGYELSKKNYLVAKSNLKCNPSLESNVEFYNVGVSSGGGEVEYVDSKDFWSTKIAAENQVVGSIKIQKTETLENLVKKHNPMILQIDIEGLEYEVLCGTKDFGNVTHIIVEIHKVEQFGRIKNELINYLYNHKYDINFQLSRANVLLFTK
jgi:FkbM family methyltransferase